MREAVAAQNLDLRDIRVLTEAATGCFAATAVMAALAGSPRVVAVTRDSSYGKAEAAVAAVRALAEHVGVADRISAIAAPAREHAGEADIVTNLGFVRPLDRDLISRLSRNAAIALMWETWEFRPADVDLQACRDFNIPILGTRETVAELMIFRYVGMTALKLLLEANIEVFRSRIFVVGADPFGAETADVLRANGAEVHLLSPEKGWSSQVAAHEAAIRACDAIVLVEHHVPQRLIGEGGIPLEWLAGTAATIVPICGQYDVPGVKALGLPLHPDAAPSHGNMSVTTHYVGPRSVIDLHAGGLKVGEALVRGMRTFGAPDKAVAFALQNSPAMDFEK
jgi:hypothetical protein